MCDHHHLRPQHQVGEVEHINNLSEHIGALCLSPDYSDITLVVETEHFPAHKVVLAARSDYFRALLYGGLRESKAGCCEVELKDTNAKAFHYLLKYIYTGRLTLLDLKEEISLEILGLAHLYGFVDLESSISNYLKAILNASNVCLIYDIANMYSLTSLCQTCCEFMDRNALEIISTESFFSMSASAVKEILSRDSFCAPEIEIFKAVQDWSNHNPDQDLSPIVNCVRLPLMSLEELLNTVRPSSLINADCILDAIKTKNESRDMDLSYRGYLTPEENVATRCQGAEVIHGEMTEFLLNGDSQNYDLDRGFTRHPIDESQGQCVVIKLPQPCIINTIRMLLWDRDQRMYSYYIEVSMDEKDWVRVVDHSRFLCRSWQYLRFPATVVRFVRIVGTYNSVNRVFHLVTFECMYTRKSVQLEQGILVPVENVATIQNSAWVIEGVSRSRNALINGDTKNYDWDSGYTCHQLGSGCIVVMLAQPYMIGSMRLLLWDCDGRSYSYYIEVSNDNQHWTRVADKTKEACKSWQIVTFKKRPITFIKIVGTHNTANEVFHCVHFECPADVQALRDYELTTPGTVSNGECTSDEETVVTSNPPVHRGETLNQSPGMILVARAAPAPAMGSVPTAQTQQQGIPQDSTQAQPQGLGRQVVWPSPSLPQVPRSPSPERSSQ